MEALLALLIGIGMYAAIYLGVAWCIWMLWLFVLPNVYPDGPQGLIQPSYWLFVAAWMLLAIVSRRVFGSRSSKSED